MIVASPVEKIDLRRITIPQARAIARLICDVWPKPGVVVDDRAERLIEIGISYAGRPRQAPRSFVVFELGRIVAHSCILSRTIGTSVGEMTIAGLSRVCTDPRQRGRGLGEMIVRAALDCVDEGDIPLALFQTSRKVEPFYSKLGCAAVENRIVNSLAGDPSASPFWDEIVMRYPADAEWPDGEIDLRGAGY